MLLSPRRFGLTAIMKPIMVTMITPSTSHWAQLSIVITATTQSAMPMIRATTV